MKYAFIIIDESELDCFIARKVVENTDRSLGITSFLNAENALEQIKDTPLVNDDITVILLDLHMPIMDGFGFVEEFEKFSPQIKAKYIVIMLSSTRNGNDIERLLSYPSVNRIIEKPLTKEKLLVVLKELNISNV
jgi:CheY-like chemotaxis protein